MRKNKIMTIPIILIVALAFSGVAYAHWFDQVHVEGVVKGGTVNIAFDYAEPPLYSEFHLVAGQLIPGEYLGKDVGSGTAEYSIEDYDVHTGKLGYQLLTIDIECAYPCYHAYTTYKLHNIGTVPVNICKFIISGARYTKDPEVFEYDLLFVPDPNFQYKGTLWEDRDHDGVVDPAVDVLVINIDVVNGLPYQLDPCHTNKGEIDIHFKQEASQCHRYYIYVYVLGLQWNKDCTFFDPIVTNGDN
jgi:hypothetical protein